MYCPNCGKPVQDGTRYCPNCGAPLNGAPAPDPAPSGYVPQPPQPAAKKSGIPKAVSAIIGIVAGVTAFMLVRYVVIPEVFSGDSGTSSVVSEMEERGTSSVVSETEDSAVSKEESSAFSAVSSSDPAESGEASSSGSFRSEYYQIFYDQGIVHFPDDFPNLDDAAFVVADDEIGMVHCMEFGYSGDIVMAMTETAYFPLEGYTEEERARLIKGMRESYAEYDGYDFCTVNGWETDSYYAIKLEYSDLNKPENRKKVIEWGMLEENAAYISLDKTEKTLLSQGYVKE